MGGTANILVREARPADAGVIVEFQERMALESEGLTLEPDTVTRGVRAVFKDPSKGRYWVAVEDRPPGGGERSVTVGVMLTVPEWSDWRNATVLWIHSLYVVPEARRRGVFKRLYAHVRSAVESSPDLAGLRLFVDKRNVAAQKAYEAAGLSREHYHLYEWLK